jgi:concanavalin A-like lectin/glucanase superfamily protein
VVRLFAASVAWPATALWGLVALAGCTRANPAYWVGPVSEGGPPVAEAGTDRAAADRGDGAAAAGPDGAAADLAAADLPVEAAADRPAGVVRGLAAYWRLDEATGSMVKDATGSGNDGTLRGAPRWMTGGFPALFTNRASLTFDGQDDSVELTSKSVPANDDPRSVSLWFKATAPSALPIRTMFAMLNEAEDAGLQLGLDHGQPAAWFYGDVQPMIAWPEVTDGAWHHLAYTYDGATHRLWYDGQQAPLTVPRTLRPPKHAPIQQIRLATWQQGMEMYEGSLDDVRVYAGALDEIEVALLASGL